MTYGLRVCTTCRPTVILNHHPKRCICATLRMDSSFPFRIDPMQSLGFIQLSRMTFSLWLAREKYILQFVSALQRSQTGFLCFNEHTSAILHVHKSQITIKKCTVYSCFLRGFLQETSNQRALQLLWAWYVPNDLYNVHSGML